MLNITYFNYNQLNFNNHEDWPIHATADLHSHAIVQITVSTIHSNNNLLSQFDIEDTINIMPMIQRRWQVLVLPSSSTKYENA